jgi:hypothetical protein
MYHILRTLKFKGVLLVHFGQSPNSLWIKHSVHAGYHSWPVQSVSHPYTLLLKLHCKIVFPSPFSLPSGHFQHINAMWIYFSLSKLHAQPTVTSLTSVLCSIILSLHSYRYTYFTPHFCKFLLSHWIPSTQNIVTCTLLSDYRRGLDW